MERPPADTSRGPRGEICDGDSAPCPRSSEPRSPCRRSKMRRRRSLAWSPLSRCQYSRSSPHSRMPRTQVAPSDPWTRCLGLVRRDERLAVGSKRDSGDSAKLGPYRLDLGFAWQAPLMQYAIEVADDQGVPVERKRRRVHLALRQGDVGLDVPRARALDLYVAVPVRRDEMLNIRGSSVKNTCTPGGCRRCGQRSRGARGRGRWCRGAGRGPGWRWYLGRPG
jgi:hypothetical protein